MGNKYLTPDDPIYIHLKEWADVSKCDVIKKYMYTSSYTYVSMYIIGTENTPKHRPDARHHDQGEEDKYG